MRSKPICPVIVIWSILWLLCGCTDPGYQVTTVPGGLADTANLESLRPSGLQYTRHAAPAASPETIPLQVSGPFSLYDRAKILRAVNEWNVALNGFKRFELVSDFADPAAGKYLAGKQVRQAWTITAVHGGQSKLFGPSVALAATQPVLDLGGSITVYVDRIGRRDLGGVVMHELGHVLGLGHHRDHDRLMSSQYTGTGQQCVDKEAVHAVAAKHGLPLNQLNWCETKVASAPR